MSTSAFAPAALGRRVMMRPAIVVAMIAAIVVLVALFTPEPTIARSGDDRLTSYSAAPQGARLLYEMSDRLGWRVSRRRVDTVDVRDASAVHLVLAPRVPLRAAEAHAVLEAVRGGAGLLYVIADDDALADSLGVKAEGSGILVRGPAAPRVEGGAHPASSRDDDGCPTDATDRLGRVLAIARSMWPDAQVHLYGIAWTRPHAAGADEVFARIRAETFTGAPKVNGLALSAIGMPLGRGRVAIVSDPDLLRNDVLRVCAWGTDAITVRMLEWLREGGDVPRDHLVFDEYHQGYGARPGTLRAIALYLSRAASGHVLLQLMGAGLVLLIALGARALPPRDEPVDERRRASEHVEALGRAYSRVGATRTATARLLHGVRRRAEHRAAAGRDDEAFLDHALARAPGRASDVALVRHALAERVPARELSRVRDALERIETSLRTIGS